MIVAPMKLSALQAQVIEWLASARPELAGLSVSVNPPGVQAPSARVLKVAAACVGWDYQVDALLVAFLHGKVGKVKYENLLEGTNELIDNLQKFCKGK